MKHLILSSAFALLAGVAFADPPASYTGPNGPANYAANHPDSQLNRRDSPNNLSAVAARNIANRAKARLDAAYETDKANVNAQYRRNLHLMSKGQAQVERGEALAKLDRQLKKAKAAIGGASAGGSCGGVCISTPSGQPAGYNPHPNGGINDNGD